MEATFIYEGKIIMSFERDSINDMPKKNSYIDIDSQEYFIHNFSFMGDKVFYLLSIK